jgi:hypothetical protein
MFKKTAIAALVLGFSGVASAAMYAPAPAPACSAGNVTVPCETSAWDIGGEALVLNAREGSLQRLPGRSADWGWGFRIEGSYHFGTGNDFNVNWAHYDKTTTTAVTAADGIAVNNPGNVDFQSRFDIVNFEFAQHVDFGEMWDVRFHGGVQYANLRNDVTSANGVLVAGVVSTSELKVSGWGPRAGADATYNFGNGFAVFGNSSVSVLSASEDLSFANAAAVLPAGVTAGSRNSMVTATEMKLGAKYTHAMAQGDLTLGVAWEAHNFINANLGVANLAWDGVSFGLKWVGNA